MQIRRYVLFFPFLCKGVTSADSKHEGKVEDLIELFMLFHKNSAKTSAFSFTTLVRISEHWDALFISKLCFFFQYLPWVLNIIYYRIKIWILINFKILYHISKFVLKIFHFSTKLICFLTQDLSESEGFITFQKSLLSDTLFFYLKGIQ